MKKLSGIAIAVLVAAMIILVAAMIGTGPVSDRGSIPALTMTCIERAE